MPDGHVFLSHLQLGQTSGTMVHPVLRLEKPKYLLGESIRFWVGVEVAPPGVIPHDARKPCSLEITKPDGSSETQSIGWPIDGNPDIGWRGGWGFIAKSPGSYFLVLECAGNRTPQLPLMVEKNEISDEVSAAFRFERSGPIEIGTPVPVIFSVTNESPFPIRFPKRGVMMEGISLSMSREKPSYRSDFFYSWEKLSQFPLSPDTLVVDLFDGRRRHCSGVVLQATLFNNSTKNIKDFNKSVEKLFKGFPPKT